jgi:hypothetical protein
MLFIMTYNVGHWAGYSFIPATGYIFSARPAAMTRRVLLFPRDEAMQAKMVTLETSS